MAKQMKMKTFYATLKKMRTGWIRTLDLDGQIRLVSDDPITGRVMCFCPITAVAWFKKKHYFEEIEASGKAAVALNLDYKNADRIIDAADWPIKSKNSTVTRYPTIRRKIIKALGFNLKYWK